MMSHSILLNLATHVHGRHHVWPCCKKDHTALLPGCMSVFTQDTLYKAASWFGSKQTNRAALLDYVCAVACSTESATGP